MHGIEHWTHFYTDYGVGLQKRFFGHFLKGERQRLGQAAARSAQCPPPGEKFVIRHEDDWPLARTQWTKFYLATDAQNGHDRAGDSAKVTFDAMGDGVTFLTAPLEKDTEITGPVAAKLHVSSSTSDADLFWCCACSRQT